MCERHNVTYCNAFLTISLSQDYMFWGATAFNQDLSGWDVSSGNLFVSSLEVFASLKLFSSFVSSVKDTTVLTMPISPFHFWQNGMFRSATAFNQPIGGWDVSSGTDFVSSLEVFESLKLFSSFVRSMKDMTHGLA
jgi:hypothetical protein